MRIMDAQTRAEESTALLALATACVAQAGLDYDLGRRPSSVPARLIEENMWRAIRYGMDGRQIDLETIRQVPARSAVEGLLEWTEPARAELKLDNHLETLERMLDLGNGAQRQWRRHEAGEPMRDMYASAVSETRASFAGRPAGVGACAGG